MACAKRFVPAGLLLLVFFVFVSPAVPAPDAWVARYNGPGNGIDSATCLAVDASGNVYVTGQSLGVLTLTDYATLKYSPAGDLLWTRRYNGRGNGIDHPTSLAVDGVGEVYVTGLSAGWGTGQDYATVKYDTNGTLRWVRRYNGPGNGQDGAISVAADELGNVYVTGSSMGIDSGFDYATLKYDPAGYLLWEQRFNGTGNSDDWANSLAVDFEGNLLVTGVSKGSGTGGDYATLKYDPEGNLVWVDRYNGPVNGYDEPNWMTLDREGNVYVTGTSEGGDTKDDFATLKYGPDGTRLWVDRYNGPGASVEKAVFVAVDHAGNAYVTGSSGAWPRNDFATLKIDPGGTRLWVVLYDGLDNGDDTPAALAVDGEGTVYVTGTSGVWPRNDYVTVQYGPGGTQLQVARYNGSGNGGDTPAFLTLDGEGQVYVTGKSAGGGTGDDYATLKNPHRVCFDYDGDGYSGNPSSACCSTLPWDCRDFDPEGYPGSPENCFNGADDNCDGMRDYEDPRCRILWDELGPLTHEGMDSDRDGLSNLEELELWWYGYGITDKLTLNDYIVNFDDVDGDGIPDGLETIYGTDPRIGNDPPESLTTALPDWKRDRDGDGLIDGLEITVFKTNPLEDDTDGDGFDDGSEIKKGSNPSDPVSVPEYLGVVVGRVEMTREPGQAPVGVNGVEVSLSANGGGEILDRVSTSPLFGRDGSFIFGIDDLEDSATFSIDIEFLPGSFRVLTDLPKSVEVRPYASGGTGGIVLELAGFVDRDGDGVPAEVEARYGTPDSKKDTDGDGMPDGFEILHNPARVEGLCCDPTNAQDADRDADGDGISNKDEMGWSDPNNPENRPLCDGEDPLSFPASGSLLKVRVMSEQGEVPDICMDTPSLIPNSVTGRVASELTGAGLPGARVFFLQGSGCPAESPCAVVSEVVSLENGIFWNILGSGGYWIKACRDGYYPEETAVQVKPGQPSGFALIALRPRDPEKITPDTWAAFSGGHSGTSRSTVYRSRTPSSGTASEGTFWKTLFVPLPLQRWGDRGVSKQGLSSTDQGTRAEGPLLSGRYQLEVSAQARNGTAVSRVEPDRISRAFVELVCRPGDAVGEAGTEDPDGRVTTSDACFALALAVGKEGYRYRTSLDVVPTTVRHDDQGKPVFAQDGRVGIEDALAVLREAQGSLDPPLPESLRTLKAPRALRFNLADTSQVTFFNEQGRLAADTTMSGTADFEFLSFPVDNSGTAFRIRGYETETEEAIIPWIGPIPISFRLWLAEGEGENALGTVVYAGQTGGIPNYNFRFDNFFVNLDVRFRGVPLAIEPHVPLELYGSFAGGAGDGDPITMKTGFFGFEDQFSVLLNFECFPP